MLTQCPCPARPLHLAALALSLLTTALPAQSDEEGFTFRLFDIQEEMDRLYPLREGQSPNVDEKHAVIDYESTQSFAGFADQFLVELSGRLRITTPGLYQFRLTSDDGSTLHLNETLLIANDGVHAAVAEVGEVELESGDHDFAIRYFENAGGQRLLLEWQLPGASAFVRVPAETFRTLANVTRVVAPGKKEIIRPGGQERPGNGQALAGIHPSWSLRMARPADFTPKVGALALHNDGRLFVATFEPNQFGFPEPSPGGDGKVYALTNPDHPDPSQIEVTEIANGLSEPLGMTFVDGDPVVSERLAITRLLDEDGDGFYETHETLTEGWTSDNYHHFHFGLLEKEGFLYSALSTAINRSSDFPGQEGQHRGLNGANPPHRGSLMKTNLLTGEHQFIAGGLRTPNGFALGPEGTILNADNQGGWVPTSKIQVLEEGRFYGFYNDTQLTNSNYPEGGAPSDFADQPVTPPALWLPHSEVAKSPSQIVPLESGIYAGHYLFGEVTLGGIRRASLEKVNGVWQGCAYRFSQGFEGGVNRLLWSPEGSLYVGCIGATSNWSWRGTTSGLQRLEPRADGTIAYDVKQVRALPDGFEIEYTKPIDPSYARHASNFAVQQWTYTPTPDYGGPKQQQASLLVTAATLSADGRRVQLQVNGLREGFVHHLVADPPSATGETLWTTEAWYTLNAIPTKAAEAIREVTLSPSSVLENQEAGTVVGTFSATHEDAEAVLTFTLPEGQSDNEHFYLEDRTLLTATSFDFERCSDYSLLLRVNDELGNFKILHFEVSVLDDPEEHAPNALALSSHLIPLPHPTSYQIAEVGVSDPDPGDIDSDNTLSLDDTANLLAAESFNYSDGSLAGQSGGQGFSGPWNNVSGTTSTSNQAAYQSSESARIVRLLDTSPSSPLATYLDSAGNLGKDGTTLYLSYLQQLPQGGLNSTGIVEMRRDGNGDNNTQFNTGVDTSPAPASYGLRLKRNASLTLPAPSGATSERHRLVLKIEFGPANEDRISFYQDPTAGEESNPIGSLSATDLSFDRIGFGSFQGGQLLVGDIRLADSFAAVVPQTTQGSHLLTVAAGEGDEDNQRFKLLDKRLLTGTNLSSGTYRIRLQATDSAGLSHQQSFLLYAGDGLADDDGDGLNNRDEVRHGLDPSNGTDASLDRDGDGQDDRAEILAGSDPLDPQSRWQASLGHRESQLVLAGTTRRGHFYALQESDDLLTWAPRGESIVAHGELTEWLLPIGLSSPTRRFLRLSADPFAGTAIDLLANGLSDWRFVNSDPAEWNFEKSSGILKHVRSLSSGFIAYPGTFRNFILRLQFKTTPGTNAGIFTRADPASTQPWVDGNEIQIDNIDPEGPDRETGSVYRRIAASPPFDPADGVWHSLEIRQIENSIRVTIDGLVLVDALDTKLSHPGFDWRDEGFIGLQDSHHNPLGTTIEYRNLHLFPLP
ncbi:family 16 glycoside hydrolase [Roseibacillus ishigakijimensis]|nr:family 16 glycoside hydrolase [Roseibacillus ishigakijimensis]